MMTNDPLTSDRFAPTPNVSNFKRHVATLQDMDGVVVTAADEEDKMIAATIGQDDEKTQERVEQFAYDCVYDVTAGYREDIGKYCVVMEDAR